MGGNEERMVFYVSTYRFRTVKDQFQIVGATIIRKSDPTMDECAGGTIWEHLCGENLASWLRPHNRR